MTTNTRFSPKDNFLQLLEAHAKDLRSTVQQPFFLTGCNFALAHMAKAGATAEQLSGATHLIASLQAIGEPEAKLPKFPVRRLNADSPEKLKKESNE